MPYTPDHPDQQAGLYDAIAFLQGLLGVASPAKLFLPAADEEYEKKVGDEHQPGANRPGKQRVGHFKIENRCQIVGNGENCQRYEQRQQEVNGLCFKIKRLADKPPGFLPAVPPGDQRDRCGHGGKTPYDSQRCVGSYSIFI